MFFAFQKFSSPGMKTYPKHTLSRKAMIIGNASFIIIVVSLLYSNKLCLCDYIACESKFKALILYYFTGLGRVPMRWYIVDNDVVDLLGRWPHDVGLA